MAQNSFRQLNDNEYHMLEKLFGIRHLIGDNGHIPASFRMGTFKSELRNFLWRIHCLPDTLLGD